MVGDPIADFLNRIKIASQKGQSRALVPYSQLKMSLATNLQQEGYVFAVNKKGKGVKKQLEVVFFDDNGKASRKIQGARRVSRQSRRVYTGAKDFHRNSPFNGRAILSTPKGILTDFAAKKENVGGEVLFEIW